MGYHITLGMDDFKKKSVDQALQSKLMKVPKGGHVFLSPYKATKQFFCNIVVPNLSAGTIDLFVSVLKDASYHGSETEIYDALLQRLNRDQIKILASGASYNWVKTHSELRQDMELKPLVYRAALRYADLDSSYLINDALSHVTKAEIIELVKVRPELIPRVLENDNCPKEVAEQACKSSDPEVLLAVLKLHDCLSAKLEILNTKRDLLVECQDLSPIADFIKENYANIDLQITFSRKGANDGTTQG